MIRISIAPQLAESSHQQGGRHVVPARCDRARLVRRRPELRNAIRNLPNYWGNLLCDFEQGAEVLPREPGDWEVGRHGEPGGFGGEGFCEALEGGSPEDGRELRDGGADLGGLDFTNWINNYCGHNLST